MQEQPNIDLGNQSRRTREQPRAETKDSRPNKKKSQNRGRVVAATILGVLCFYGGWTANSKVSTPGKVSEAREEGYEDGYHEGNLEGQVEVLNTEIRDRIGSLSLVLCNALTDAAMEERGDLDFNREDLECQ